MQTRIMPAVNWGDARLSERFWAKTSPEPMSGCWLWTGSVDAGGYGQIRIEWKLYTAHILAYRTLVGEYAGGLDLDHKCRNRACANPLHLEPVTRAVNLARGAGFHVRKTHCPKGHPYDEQNTRIYRGMRYCKACKRKGAYVPRIPWQERIKPA